MINEKEIDVLNKPEENKEVKPDFDQKILNTKKYILKEITKLNKLEHIEIFKILKNNNIIYTENVNGIFVNMKNLDINTLNDIIKFINYVKNKNIELLEKETILKKTKNEIYGLNNNEINNLESKIQILKENLKSNLKTLNK
jgi:protein subunit release factor A